MTLPPTAPMASAGHDTMGFLLGLAALVTAARLLGAIARRFGQPAVLGELLAGLLLGPSLLGLVSTAADHPAGAMLHTFAELGVLLLLFQIGLHTDIRSLLKVGPAALVVAVVGVALPFFTGMGVAHLFGLSNLVALVLGASLTATSVGISARVLDDLGLLQAPEGQTVLGAAVLDDIIGLIILAVVAGVAGGGTLTVGAVALTSGAAIGFLLVVILLGRLVIPPLFARIARIRTPHTTGILAIVLAVVIAALADRSGSAPIIGAFAAGLILHDTPQRAEIEQESAGIGEWFVPIFFAAIGAMIDVHAILSPAALSLGGALLAVGIVSKFLAGYAPWWQRLRYALVGVAMIPRGEVGLIFAQKGLETGVLLPTQFGAIMLMVVGTTVVAPPWLAWLGRGVPSAPKR